MQTLLSLMSGVALLIWGTHIVRTGMLSLFGANLRQVIAAGTSNRATGFVAGVGVTALVQSSSATALITSAFVSQGLVSLPAALPVMLGADVGTSLIAQALSINIAWLSPLLLLVGIVLFLTNKATRRGQVGTVLIGLGQITLALQLIRLYTSPLLHAEILRNVFATLSGDLALNVVIGAILATAAYSSLAVVLFTATLASSGVITVSVALPLVLGANLGSGLLAVLANANADRAARRVSIANLLFRSVGCLLFMPVLPYIETVLLGHGLGDQAVVVNFHTLFNITIAAVLIWFVEPIARLCMKLLPDPGAEPGAAGIKYLMQEDLSTPSLALANASREVFRIAEVLEQMLEGMKASFATNDKAFTTRVRSLDDRIDELYSSIKMYLTEVGRRHRLSEAELQRSQDLMAMTISLEQAGDIVDRLLADVEERKFEKNFSFSNEGRLELEEMCSLVSENLRFSMSVFISRDPDSGAHLLMRKSGFSAMERRHAMSHLMRVTERRVASMETSSLHLDILRDLKHINSLLCSATLSVMERGPRDNGRFQEQAETPALGGGAAYPSALDSRLG